MLLINGFSCHLFAPMSYRPFSYLGEKDLTWDAAYLTRQGGSTVQGSKHKHIGFHSILVEDSIQFLDRINKEDFSPEGLDSVANIPNFPILSMAIPLLNAVIFTNYKKYPEIADPTNEILRENGYLVNNELLIRCSNHCNQTPSYIDNKILFFSLPITSGLSGYLAYFFNKKLLQKWQGAKRAYVGGNCIESDLFELPENYYLVKGRNLKNFDKNLGNQLLDYSTLFDFKTDRNLLENLDPQSYRVSDKDILNAYGMQQYLKAESSAYVQASYFLTSRSKCYYKCAFCADRGSEKNAAIHFTGSQRDGTLPILKALQEKGFNSLYLLDCVTNPSYSTLVEYIEKHSLQFNWFWALRLDLIEPYNLNILRRIGVRFLNIGIETFESKQQIYIRKKLNVDLVYIKEKLQMCHDFGMLTNINLIYSIPYCREDEVEFNEECLEKLGGPDVYNGVTTHNFRISGVFQSNPERMGVDLTDSYYKTRDCTDEEKIRKDLTTRRKLFHRRLEKPQTYLSLTRHFSLVSLLFQLYGTYDKVWGIIKEHTVGQ